MRTIFPADAGLIEKIPSVLAARAGGEARISAIYRGDDGRRLVSLLSPEQLFREDVMQRLNAGGAAIPDAPGERRTRHAARNGSSWCSGWARTSSACRSRRSTRWRACPTRSRGCRRRPKFLEGVVNLRGDVLPVVDQRRRFDMPALDGARRAPAGRRPDRAPRAGLIVDAVSEVLRCFADDIEPAPDLTDEAVRLVHGVINLEKAGRIVLLLDPAELLTRAERGLLDAFQSRTERARVVTKVLVVDDSALMRKLLGRIFSTEPDFEVQFARNGLEALELLDVFKPDVVTLDIHMPQMDGLACLDRIMVEHPCPVVMVSSLTAEGADATLEALRLGAIDFVAKPEGAISLHIDELTGELVAKVRAAAGARIRSSARLKERVRHRIGGDAGGDPAGRPLAGRAGHARPRASAKGWCWSAPRPAGRRRWKPC